MSATPLGFEVSDFLNTISQCGTKSDAFEIFAYNYVNREEIARRKETERQRAEQRKKLKLIVAGICGVVIIVVAIIINNKVIIPSNKYHAATESMANGNYKEALAILKEINGFRDSTDLIEECRFELYEPYYLQAVSFMEKGQYQDALNYFQKASGYKDSSILANKCDTEIKQETYDLGIAYMESGSYDAAMASFHSISGFKDSADLAVKCKKLKLIAPTMAAKIGETVFWGTYEQDNNDNGKEPIEWIVLDKTDDSALLISKYGLDYQQYDQGYSSVTWETCSLRSWMNNSFLNNAFSDDELDVIETTLVKAIKTEDFDTDPGNDTRDKIFALSIEDAEKYFDSDEARKCQPTAYAKRREAYVGENGRCWWWLRSPGETGTYALLVGDDGVIYENYANGYGRIMPIDTGSHWGKTTARPAMWVGLG